MSSRHRTIIDESAQTICSEAFVELKVQAQESPLEDPDLGSMYKVLRVECGF